MIFICSQLKTHTSKIWYEKKLRSLLISSLKNAVVGLGVTSTSVVVFFKVSGSTVNRASFEQSQIITLHNMKKLNK